VLSDDEVRSVLVNVFGGITSCDAVATGIVETLTRLWSRPAVLDHIGADHEDLERGLVPAPGPSVTRRGRLIL